MTNTSRQFLARLLSQKVLRYFKRMTKRPCWTVLPFSELYPPHDDSTEAIDAAELLTGVVASVSEDGYFYEKAVSLLGQQPNCRMVGSNRRYVETGYAIPPTRRLYAAMNAGMIGHTGVVYDAATGVAFQETARTWVRPVMHHPAVRAITFEKPTFVDGVTLSLATLGGNGFYHFLFEALPRLELARSWLDRIEHFVCNGGPGTYHERWLNQAGIPSHKLIWLGEFTHYVYATLLFSNRLMGDQRPTPWIINAIRNSVGVNENKSGHRRIWISRKDANVRKFSWEDDFIRRLIDVEPVVLTNLTPKQHIDLITECSAILGPHGAGLSSVIFGNPGGKLVELFQDQYLMPCYSRYAYLNKWQPAWAAVNFDQAPDLDLLAEKTNQFLSAVA